MGLLLPELKAFLKDLMKNFDRLAQELQKAAQNEIYLEKQSKIAQAELNNKLMYIQQEREALSLLLTRRIKKQIFLIHKQINQKNNIQMKIRNQNMIMIKITLVLSQQIGLNELIYKIKNDRT